MTTTAYAVGWFLVLYLALGTLTRALTAFALLWMVFTVAK